MNYETFVGEVRDILLKDYEVESEVLGDVLQEDVVQSQLHQYHDEGGTPDDAAEAVYSRGDVW